jgi:hypothetical protein
MAQIGLVRILSLAFIRVLLFNSVLFRGLTLSSATAVVLTIAE